jgi:hypothetical protein
MTKVFDALCSNREATRPKGVLLESFSRRAASIMFGNAVIDSY